MPTKTDVLNYRATHFANTAEHLTQVGEQWTTSSETQNAEMMALTDQHWKGLAAGMYLLVSQADHAEVMAGATQAHAAAAVAAADGELVMGAQKTAQYAIEDADGAGIDVSEGFQLSDRYPTPPLPGWREWRQAEIQYHAGQIETSVNALVVADQQAAAKMRAVGDFSAYHTSPNGHITGVDFKTDCLTPDQLKDKLLHDGLRGAVPGVLTGGAVSGPIGILIGGATGAITNDTGDLIDILDGTTELCTK